MDREELARHYREEINRLQDAQLVDYVITWVEGGNVTSLSDALRKTILIRAQIDGTIQRPFSG